MGKKTNLEIGDFVEANLLHDKTQQRRGIITQVFENGTVVVEMSTTSSMCEQPKKIEESGLAYGQKWWLANKREELQRREKGSGIF
jgi:hypothetical protein